MEWINIKEILDEEFPKDGAMLGDITGELVPIPKEITGIMITLDVTLDVIAQALEKKCNLIISHHPFYWGDSIEDVKNDKPYLKQIFDLMVSNGIGNYVCHTNADYAPNSLAYMQALALDLQGIEHNDKNLSVSGYLKESMTIKEFSEKIKINLELTDAEFRTNIEPNASIQKITISSGTSGEYGIMLNDSKALHIVGEVKHHEWVRANERDIKVFELNHFSERIFKTIVKVFLEREDIHSILSIEPTPYKIV